MARLLIIEDNSDIQAILRGQFAAEHTVFQAYSGTEGLLIFREQAIELILLDIMLPGLSGDGVLAEIRAVSQVPVIMLTALGEKERVSRYLLSGANDYVTKPFDLDELSARVAVQLRQLTAPEKSKTLTYGTLSLHFEDFTVSVNGNSARLSRLEFEILAVLMRAPKQIFTKEKLYEAVWQTPAVSGDNSVNTHLSNLRKKLLGLDAGADYIETIWGLGVRMRQVANE
ncbi:MAG: response regulator transcription factor [Streptococcaceae bacterium]|jgi:DNA-binding response OmpR family regulator|nr:response regulator transcription factor [Streptococcaceae bacterium]